MKWPALLISALGLILWGLPSSCTAAQQTRSDDSAHQTWCSDQAKRVAQKLDLETKRGDRYRGNYNRSVNKCFVAIEIHRGKIITKSLLDAYALRTYASYFWMANAPSLTRCTLMPAEGEEKKCNSDKEYEAFVSATMGNAARPARDN